MREESRGFIRTSPRKTTALPFRTASRTSNRLKRLPNSGSRKLLRPIVPVTNRKRLPASVIKKYSMSPKHFTRSPSTASVKIASRKIDFGGVDEKDSEFSEGDIEEMFKQAQQEVEAEKPDGFGLPLTKQINYCRFGRYEIRAWYPSPYPESLAHLNRVYICQFCLKCLSSSTLFRRHAAKCIWRYPPGNEIYRDRTRNLSFWEVDGKVSKIYCQNLCLLAKLFLDHKTLYFDVEPFLFYVLTQADAEGCHMIGYFSKEKESVMNCNLSCLLTLPPFMRRGYGRYLIEFSYLLSKLENKIGSPEHPLSDMGLLTYRNYWKDAIFEYMGKIAKERVSVSIKDISLETGIHQNDIVSTLQFLGMIKYWKGQYVLDKRPDVFEEFMAKRSKRQQLRIDIKNLSWTPGESLH